MIIFQRVDAEYIKESFHSLYNIIIKIKAFIHLITDVSQTAFQRINAGVNNVLELVIEMDFNLMQQIAADHFDDYVTSYGQLSEGIQTVMDKIMIMSPSIVNELTSTKTDHVKAELEGSVHRLLDGWDTSSNVKSHPRSRTIKHMPSRLVSDQLRLDQCETIQSNITAIFQSTFLLEPSTETFETLETMTISECDMNELRNLYRRYTAKKCLSDLPSKLTYLANVMKETRFEVQRIMEGRPGLEDAMYLESEQAYLHKLEATATWLTKQLTDYSENRTTKIELSKDITHSMLSEIELTLDHIISAVERTIIDSLLSTAGGVLRNVNNWYQESLIAITRLVPFYYDSEIEDRLRALKIWRRPVARLETADILQFQYPGTEAWRSWDLRTTLEDFVFSGNATRIIFIYMNEYIHSLQSELMHMHMEIKQFRKDVIRAFKYAMEDFANVRVESSLGSNFVMWVWGKTLRNREKSESTFQKCFQYIVIFSFGIILIIWMAAILSVNKLQS